MACRVVPSASAGTASRPPGWSNPGRVPGSCQHGRWRDRRAGECAQQPGHLEHPFETGALVDVTEQVIPDTGSTIISTTRDINTFFRALLGGELLRPAQLAEMTRTEPVSPELQQLMPGAEYGLGLFERPLPCGSAPDDFIRQQRAADALVEEALSGPGIQ